MTVRIVWSEHVPDDPMKFEEQLKAWHAIHNPQHQQPLTMAEVLAGAKEIINQAGTHDKTNCKSA
jgi:hypothetical protein